MSKKITVLIGNWKSRREDHHDTKTFNHVDEALAFWWASANMPTKQEVWIPARRNEYDSNRRLPGQSFPSRLATALIHGITPGCVYAAIKRLNARQVCKCCGQTIKGAKL